MPRLSGLEAAERLKKMGAPIPPEIEELIRVEEYAKHGIIEVWKCPKCGFIYESKVRMTAISCRGPNHPNSEIPNLKRVWIALRYR